MESAIYWMVGMHHQLKKDGQRLQVDKNVFHPNYTRKRDHDNNIYEDYDIAISKTKKEIEFNINVRPICLPNVHDDIIGRHGIVAGWWCSWNKKKIL